MCRRSITQRATQKTCKCKFFFSVQHDDFGFFLAPRVGYPQHCFHSKLTNDQIVFPPRLLNKETRSMIEKISKADGNHTIAANVVFHTTGIMLSNDNIAYLSGLCNDLEKIDKIKKQNSTEKMINYLKKKKYNHMVLYHDGKKNQLINLCQTDSRTQWMNLPPDEKVDLEKFVDGHRNILQVEKEKALFIGLAWVLPIEQKFFHHFPEVICVDTVSHTNKDKRPLLTISGRDSYGKMFIILRAFLPNERAWVFMDFFYSNANIVSILYLIQGENTYIRWLSTRIYAN